MDKHTRLLELELENAALRRLVEAMETGGEQQHAVIRGLQDLLRELEAEIERLQSQLELNLQNVRYLMLHGGVSH